MSTTSNPSILAENFGVGQLRRTTLNHLRNSAALSFRAMITAINQAEAIAYETAFPHLLLPLLAEEKAQENARLLGHHPTFATHESLALAA